MARMVKELGPEEKDPGLSMDQAQRLAHLGRAGISEAEFNALPEKDQDFVNRMAPPLAKNEAGRPNDSAQMSTQDKIKQMVDPVHEDVMKVEELPPDDNLERIVENIDDDIKELAREQIHEEDNPKDEWAELDKEVDAEWDPEKQKPEDFTVKRELF